MAPDSLLLTFHLSPLVCFVRPRSLGHPGQRPRGGGPHGQRLRRARGSAGAVHLLGLREGTEGPVAAE